MQRYILFITPFLLVLSSLLQLNFIASMYVSPGQLLRPLFALWTIIALLFLPSYWICRDWTWATALLSVLVIGFSFSPDFFITFIMTFALISVAYIAFARLRRIYVRIHHLLTILAVVGLFFTSYTVYLLNIQLNQVNWRAYSQEIKDARSYFLLSLSSPANLPDIYYIIVDEYARSDILQEFFNFDNKEFLNYLQQKGFIIPDSNHSNYPATTLSIASTLNMDYIQSLAPSIDRNSQRWLINPFIDYSRVRALLDGLGYQTVSLSSNYSPTENDTTDLYLHPYPVILNDFERYLLGSTPLKIFEPLFVDLISRPTVAAFQKIISYEFTTLADLPSIPGPKFVFVHIISPHPPYVFDENGNPVNEGQRFTYTGHEPHETHVYKYRNQVQFVNHGLEKAIDKILANSKTPPIILIQADHGSSLYTNLSSPENSCIQERFAPFAAYYLPGMDQEAIPPDVTNVNLFRIVFNRYFDAGLPLLENRQYFSQDRQHFFLFLDVTGRLDDACTPADK